MKQQMYGARGLLAMRVIGADGNYTCWRWHCARHGDGPLRVLRERRS